MYTLEEQQNGVVVQRGKKKRLYRYREGREFCVTTTENRFDRFSRIVTAPIAVYLTCH